MRLNPALYIASNVTCKPKNDAADDNGQKMKEKIMKQTTAQKQECSSPSLQPSLRCYTLSFLAPRLLLMWFICIDTFSQPPIIMTPGSSPLLPSGIIDNKPKNNGYSIPNVPNYNTGRSIEQTNMDIINKDLNQSNNSYNSTSNDIDEQNQSYYRQQLMNYIQSNYMSAFNNIKNMLEGNTPLDVKKAVFEVEHAFNNTFTYEDYNSNIQELVKIIKYLNGNNTNNVPLNLSICKAMSDTVSMPMPSRENKSVSYPLVYDFDDYYGDKDYNKMFVSKLLSTHSGQCHSMPLLYLILAQEIGAQAYLSFSPNHSFIRFKDKRGKLHNYETTQGKIVSDEWLMGSGFITSNAVKSGIFLDTLNKKQVVAYCLNDLAMGYIKLFGMNDTSFISKCTDLSLQYYPDKNANAYVLKSNMYLNQLILIMKQKGVKDHKEIMNDPKAKQFWDKHNYLYNMLANKGFKNIQREAYDKWLKSAKEVKNLKDSYQSNKGLRNSIQ